jgi:2,4-dienoyl-CoA reductase [(3E)-enoyl-CoA-producing], peroxisomal
MSGLSSNAFKAVMDIDTIGTFHTIKATIPHLIASASRNPNPNDQGTTGGRILAISATFHYTGMPLQAHVSAAKAAVDSLMASVAIEYGPHGITSNIIAPGAIAGTEGYDRLSSGDIQSHYARGVPSGRWGSVRDIADATVFLFSDAGNYVNGTTLMVDGAGWRRQAALSLGLDADMKYPDYLLEGKISQNIKKGGRLGSKSKM